MTIQLAVAAGVLLGGGVVLSLAFRLARSGARLKASQVHGMPPLGLGPAELGYARAGRLEVRDLLATIVDLALRGHLQVTALEWPAHGSGPRNFRLVRVQGPGKLRGYERVLLETVGRETDLRALLRDHPGLLRALRIAVAEENRSLPMHSRRAARVTAAAVGALLVGGGIAASAWQVDVRGAWLPVVVVSTALGLGVLGLAVPGETEARKLLLARIAAFAEMLENVVLDGPRAPDDDEVFKLFPYAIALGPAGRWLGCLWQRPHLATAAFLASPSAHPAKGRDLAVLSAQLLSWAPSRSDLGSGLHGRETWRTAGHPGYPSEPIPGFNSAGTFLNGPPT